MQEPPNIFLWRAEQYKYALTGPPQELLMPEENNDSTFDSLIRLRTKRQSFREQHIDPEVVKAKVIEDINFLRDRIAHIKRSKFCTPNPTILKTYESMLESREAVLAWLKESSLDNRRDQARQAKY